MKVALPEREAKEVQLTRAIMTTATDLRMLMGTTAPGVPTLPQESALPRLRPELDLNDSTLFAVYCFIKNFIGASGTSAVAIDNKIEQAMDLVKSHLMFAVREEVEVLKEKIAELMDRINQLELENTILKAHASQETLAQLGGNNPQQQGNKNQQTQPPPNGSVS